MILKCVSCKVKAKGFYIELVRVILSNLCFCSVFLIIIYLFEHSSSKFPLLPLLSLLVTYKKGAAKVPLSCPPLS